MADREVVSLREEADHAADEQEDEAELGELPRGARAGGEERRRSAERGDGVRALHTKQPPQVSAPVVGSQSSKSCAKVNS